MSEQTSEKQAKKGLPIKTIVVVLGLLVIEAVVVIGAVTMLGKPNEVQGQGFVDETPGIDEQMSEVLIVADKFPNHHTGRVWLWDTEVQVKVKGKHLEHVQSIVQDRSAELKSGIGRIIRTAHHNHLKEPNLETISRQLREYLYGVFGQDAEGEDRLQEVFLPRCVGFPADF